jgi:hypothetical protein
LLDDRFKEPAEDLQCTALSDAAQAGVVWQGSGPCIIDWAAVRLRITQQFFNNL